MIDTQRPMVNQEKKRKYTTQLILLDVSMHNPTTVPTILKTKIGGITNRNRKKLKKDNKTMSFSLHIPQ